MSDRWNAKLIKYEGCCIYPHGKLSFYVCVLVITAWLFTLTANLGCYFVRVNASFSDTTSGGLQKGTKFRSGFGLFSFEDRQREGQSSFVCYMYRSDELDYFDSTFTTARAFGIIAIVCTGVAMFLLCIMACFKLKKWILNLLGILMAVASIFEWLTFLIFASNLCESPLNCNFYIGAGIAIAAAITSILSAVIIMRIPYEPDEYTGGRGENRLQPFAPGTETTTETIMPDGSKKIAKITVNPDGTQMVEETIVYP